jgi:nitric oxide reductase NorE protein
MDTKKIDYKNIYYPPGGMLIWIVIFLELITFGIAIVALALFSKDDPEGFHASRLLLNPTFGAINTIFLLSSGFFMATSLKHFKKGNQKKSSLFLKLTLLGGLLFIALKSIEYYQKIEHGLDMDYSTFFNFYWLLTGFHVIHVLVGIVILIILYFGINKKESTTELEDFEASTAFWHMCDLIWLLLFPMLYLIL